MCGIVGFLDKTQNHEYSALGRILLDMLKALACRGPDSAGVALFGPPTNGQFVVKVKLGNHGESGLRAQRLSGLVRSFGVGEHEFSTVAAYARFVVDGGIDLTSLIDSIERSDKEIEVVSAGRNLEIVKQVGSPANLEKTYGIARFCGTHGLGHTRLSTESRVDLSHSQPFWSHRRPDLAIVHNGHITNYHKLRRLYQQHDVRFYTENDSEVVAIYLSDRLNQGRSLEESLRAMLRELDGSFSCLVATATELGFVKDPFALKPLLWAETDGFVAVANEEIAIRSALPGAYQVREAEVKEVRVWER
ncbi:MAG: glutamine phosphoribosylpyrophosphate amidotransferase [Acidobacteria bacterium]|nr:MAG: glutamine phosphoribosylpyrophosphate amidotransferase [Acidobacteriota bacterium]